MFLHYYLGGIAETRAVAGLFPPSHVPTMFPAHACMRKRDQWLFLRAHVNEVR